MVLPAEQVKHIIENEGKTSLQRRVLHVLLNKVSRETIVACKYPVLP